MSLQHLLSYYPLIENIFLFSFMFQMIFLMINLLIFLASIKIQETVIVTVEGKVDIVIQQILV